MIAVVIPFYQRERGLLERAIRSVAAQSLPQSTPIYVVDDGSPVPAEDEIGVLPTSVGHSVTIIKTANRGAAAARNTALAAIGEEASAIAFLDSDDAWSSDHLLNASEALSAGADFYFADWRREEDADTRFAQCGYDPDGPDLGNLPIKWCTRQSLFRFAALRSPIGTSTVVIRRESIGNTRFPADFRAAGEDSIFWLRMLIKPIRIACGWSLEASYGRGVSIFNHRSWGDVRSLNTILDQMRFQRHMLEEFSLDCELVAATEAQCSSLDVAFCSAMLACVRRYHTSALAPALDYFRVRPQALLRMPLAFAHAVSRKL